MPTPRLAVVVRSTMDWDLLGRIAPNPTDYDRVFGSLPNTELLYFESSRHSALSATLTDVEITEKIAETGYSCSVTACGKITYNLGDGLTSTEQFCFHLSISIEFGESHSANLPSPGPLGGGGGQSSAELSAALSRLSAAQSELSRAKSEFDRVMSDLKQANSDLDAVNRQLNQVKDELSEAERHLNTKVDARNRIASDVRAVGASTRRAKQTASDLTEEVSRLIREHDARRREITQSETALEAIVRERAASHQRVTNSIPSIQARSTALDGATGELRNRVSQGVDSHNASISDLAEWSQISDGVHLVEVSLEEIGESRELPSAPFYSGINPRTLPGQERFTAVATATAYEQLVRATELQNPTPESRRLLESGSEALAVADELFASGEDESGVVALAIAYGTLDFALSVTPGVSIGKDCYEAVTGRNLITGEALSDFERSFAVLGVISLGLGSKLSFLGKGVDAVASIGSRLGSGLSAAWKRTFSKSVESAASIRARLSNAGEFYPRTTIPRYFDTKIDDYEFHFSDNATKHISDYLMRDDGAYQLSRTSALANDLGLAELHSTFESYIRNRDWVGELNTPVTYDGYNFKVMMDRPGPGRELPSVVHANRVEWDN